MEMRLLAVVDEKVLYEHSVIRGGQQTHSTQLSDVGR